MGDFCKYVNVFQGCGEIDLPQPQGIAAQLRQKDTAAFSQYAAISAGARSRFAMLHLPRERTEAVTAYLYGVPDPAYETTLELAFRDLYGRISRYLDRAAADLRPAGAESC